ncbi:kelch domain-containing protein 9 [Gastrophryne carolinensis]
MTSARWTWVPVAQDDRFARAFYTCTPVRGKLYLHGGVRSGNPKEPPLDDVVTYDPEQKSVCAGESGPRRSHHDASLLGQRWLCVVGGWDGSRRLLSVLSYDTESSEWSEWSQGASSDPPAGLSSHACVKVSDGELCVVGREGGLRTQRRYGSVYTLRVDAASKTYSYKEEEWRTASRSGHSAVFLRSNPRWHSLFVFGGRESSATDVVGRWKKIQENTEPCPGLVEQLSRLVGTAGAKRAAPTSLRHFSCSAVGPFLVVFGGENLSKSRDAVCNDLFIGETRCTPIAWFHFPGSDPRHKRVGHRTCLLNDRLYLVGGLGGDGKTPCSEISALEINV